MGATANIESFLAAVFTANEFTASLTIFLFVLLATVSVRVALMFQDQPSWISFSLRLIFGFLPLAICLLLIFIAVFSDPWSAYGWSPTATDFAIPTLSGIFIGALIAYLLGRFVEPKVIQFLHQRTRHAGLQDRLTDIREVEKGFADRPIADLDKEFATAINHNQVYLGQDATGNVIAVDRKSWKTSHVQIMGPPGTGKGVQAAVTLAQSLQFGDAVFVFDPKSDEWAPSVYQAACDKASVPFEFVDLREPHPQINPILNASPDDVAELFYAGFELGRQGNTADFYRLDDRKAARLAANFVVDGTATLGELGSKAKSSADSELMTGGKAFFAALEELSELISIQTKSGIDLTEPLKRGGCLYIVGSIRNEPIITLQKMLFVRLIQLIESSRVRERHCSIFLDEFKYMLSQPALNALGSIRDKGCNILLAHQSLGDFSNCGADLDEASVRTTVLDTTPIKWLYRPADFDTASWISNQTGEILVSTQTVEATRNIELSESLSASRSVGESTRNMIDVNTVLTLPNGSAVCVGVELSKLAFTQAMEVQKITPQIVTAKLAVNPVVDLLTQVTDSTDASVSNSYLPPINWEGDTNQTILEYLYSETWTHVDIFSKLFEDLTNEQVRKSLTELAEMKLIRCVEVPFLENSTAEIWGITKHGIIRVAEKLGVEENHQKAFDKRTVNTVSLSHQLDIQKLRISAERGGWRNWIKTTARTNFRQKGENYPDATAVRPDGKRVAIEVERTIKSKNRYPGIMTSHLHSRKQGEWDEIWYFSPDVRTKKRLEKIFSEIGEVVYFGNTVKITDEHREPFRFFVYDDDWI